MTSDSDGRKRPRDTNQLAKFIAAVKARPISN
jgi:hypothetical protein